MEKFTLQAITELYVKKYGVSKKFAESFFRMFFDTIIDGLRADGVVKIQGLGSFKIIDIADRESVNVNNGERIIIPGYRKVVFTPSIEFSVRRDNAEEKINTENTEEDKIIDNSVEHTSVDISEGLQTSEIEEAAESNLPPFDSNPILTNIEYPMNEIGSIDTLISTPESIEDVRLQYEEAVAKAEEAFEFAQQKHTEMLRLKILLERLETNQSPFDDEQDCCVNLMDETALDQEEAATCENPTQDVSESSDCDEVFNIAGTENPDEDEALSEKDKALKNIMYSKHEEEDAVDGKMSGMLKIVCTIACVIIAIVSVSIFYYYYQNFNTESSVPVESTKVDKTPQQTLVVVDTVHAETDTLVSAEIEESKTEPEAVQQPESTPKTHTIQNGESLTKISRKYYGTKDSVRAIIRINNFDNPDNIPVGTVVKLP